MSTQSTTRQTADERRLAVLDAATHEFAVKGYHGASTDDIARAAGISQPYLFRLFGTKKGLYLASAERCLSDTYERFRLAAEGLTGEGALVAIGRAYKEMITADPRRLKAQMQGYAASDDPDVRDVMRRGFGRLVELVESTGVSQERVAHFFAIGMLINVMSSIDLYSADEPWAKRLIEGCMKDD